MVCDTLWGQVQEGHRDLLHYVHVTLPLKWEIDAKNHIPRISWGRVGKQSNAVCITIHPTIENDPQTCSREAPWSYFNMYGACARSISDVPQEWYCGQNDNRWFCSRQTESVVVKVWRPWASRMVEGSDVGSSELEEADRSASRMIEVGQQSYSCASCLFES